MSLKIKNLKLKINKGFTLVELLIALVVMSVIAIFTTRILFNMVSYRSKQFAIEDTSSSFRDFVNSFTRETKSGIINVMDNENVEIIVKSGAGNSCVSYRFNSSDSTIEKSTGATSPCTSSFTRILQDSIIVQSLVFSPIESPATIVNVEISGIYKDSLSETPFNFQTSVRPRI